MICPIILGSDKTTVSIGTGNHEFYPLYMSNGLVHNNIRRAHVESLTLIAFLSIPKGMYIFEYEPFLIILMTVASREYSGTEVFRTFRRQLFHTSIHRILEPLREGMTQPQVHLSPDGKYRRFVYRLGPYIADYPEQVLLTCIVQNWCPR